MTRFLIISGFDGLTQEARYHIRDFCDNQDKVKLVEIIPVDVYRIIFEVKSEDITDADELERYVMANSNHLYLIGVWVIK